MQEITRRVNITDIWQAAYTAGVVLPTPLATCRYWHRSLNPKKLIEVGFSKLGVGFSVLASWLLVDLSRWRISSNIFLM